MMQFLRNIGPMEWALIALILIILFGSKVVKALGRTGGETFREIKNIKKSFTEGITGKSDTE